VLTAIYTLAKLLIMHDPAAYRFAFQKIGGNGTENEPSGITGYVANCGIKMNAWLKKQML
jgi:hypothetical protein